MASYLTKKLDNALTWYSRLNQGSRFSKLGWKIAYNLGRFFSLGSWSPLECLKTDANPALIEAASNDDMTRVRQLLELPTIENYYKYRALVRAVQRGHDQIINLFFSLPNIESIVTNTHGLAFGGTRDGSYPINPRPRRDDPLDLQQDPNLVMEAAYHGRTDTIKRLLQFKYIRDNLGLKQYGRDPCLRAAESGHLAVVDEFLKFPEVNKILTSTDRAARMDQKDFLLFAAMKGHLGVVNRLLEFPRVVSFSAAVLPHALQYGTTQVIARLLAVPFVHKALSSDPGRVNVDADTLRWIGECAYHACYVNNQKSIETACEMLVMLLSYPVIVSLAQKEYTNNQHQDGNVMLEVLQALTNKVLADNELPIALQYGTIEEVKRLLAIPFIHQRLNSDPRTADADTIKWVQDCGFTACHVNDEKSFDTAREMFKLLKSYPIIAQLARDCSAKRSGNVWEVSLWKVLQGLVKESRATSVAWRQTISTRLSTNRSLLLPAPVATQSVNDQPSPHASNVARPS